MLGTPGIEATSGVHGKFPARTCGTLFLHLSVFLVSAFVSISVSVTVTVTVLSFGFFCAHSYAFPSYFDSRPVLVHFLASRLVFVDSLPVPCPSRCRLLSLSLFLLLSPVEYWHCLRLTPPVEGKKRLSVKTFVALSLSPSLLLVCSFSPSPF